MRLGGVLVLVTRLSFITAAGSRGSSSTGSGPWWRPRSARLTHADRRAATGTGRGPIQFAHNRRGHKPTWKSTDATRRCPIIRDSAVGAHTWRLGVKRHLLTADLMAGNEDLPAFVPLICAERGARDAARCFSHRAGWLYRTPATSPVNWPVPRSIYQGQLEVCLRCGASPAVSAAVRPCRDRARPEGPRAVSWFRRLAGDVLDPEEGNSSQFAHARSRGAVGQIVQVAGVVWGGLTGTRPSRDPATEGNTVVLLNHGAYPVLCEVSDASHIWLALTRGFFSGSRWY